MSSQLFILFHQINDEEINSLIEDHPISEIINLSNNSKQINIKIPTINAHQINEFDIITKNAIYEYTNFVSLFSKENIFNGKTIRDLMVMNLPIYWLISFSVKHPYNHWLYNVFLLKNLLINQQKKANLHLNLIYIPKELNYISTFLTTFFQSLNVKLVGCQNHTIPINKSIFSLIKSNIINIRKILKTKPEKKVNEKDRVVFLNSQTEASYINKVEKSIFKTLSQKELITENFSYLDWTKNIYINTSFYSRKPSFIPLLKILFQSIFLKIQLKKYKKSINISNTLFNTELVVLEIENFLCEKSHYLYSYFWLQNYFKDNSHLKAVFYEDEFYTFGRVISAAKKNANNSTNFNCYGIQHGMFSYFHTVYSLSDNEIESTSKKINNGIPLPDFFITWGEYFSNQLLKNNSLPKSFIKELGNPIYVFNEKNISNKTNPSFTFLYCLTSQILFEKELPIVNKILSAYPKSTLIIRNHPHFYFPINSSLFDSSCTIINSSKTSLFDDFNLSNVVLTSAHSTVFLDALAVNKKVIRLKTTIFDNSMDYHSNNCLTLDFSAKIPVLINNPNNQPSNNSFLYLDKNRWSAFIDNINA